MGQTTADNLPPINVNVVLILQGGVQSGLHLGGDGGSLVVTRRPVGHVQLHVQDVLSLQTNSACQQMDFKVPSTTQGHLRTTDLS